MSRGLGFALAEEYLKRGWYVVATERARTTSKLHDLLGAAEDRLEIETVDVVYPGCASNTAANASTSPKHHAQMRQNRPGATLRVHAANLQGNDWITSDQRIRGVTVWAACIGLPPPMGIRRHMFQPRGQNMNLQRKSVALAFIGVFIYPGVALAQPVAEKPDWKVGDYWEFRQATKKPGIGSDEETTWSRRIEGFLPNDRIQIRFENGKIEQYDSALNFIFVREGIEDQIRILAQYPLKAGAEWTFARKAGSMAGTENGSAKIVAYESITVPAGTFACYRIDSVADYANKAYSEHRVWNRWYCPEVKWIAKERLETTIRHPINPGGTTVATSELVKFTPGK